MDKDLQDQIKIDFMDLIASDASLNALCTKAAGYLKLPVALTITTRTIIARSKDYTQELVEEYSNHFRFSTPDEVRSRVRLIDSKLAQGRAFIGAFPLMRYPHINCGCFWGPQMLGVLDIPVVSACKDQAEVLETVEFLAPYFLLALRLSKYVSSQMRFSMQVYLSGLLNGTPEEWCHTNYLLDSELNRIRQWRLIYLPLLPTPQGENTWETVTQFCSRYDDTWPVEHQDGIVILKKAYGPFDLEKLQQNLPQIPRIVVSEPFSDIKLLLNHLHACQRTVDLAEFDCNESCIVFVENYKMPLAYLVLKRTPNGMSLYHPSIDLIHRHDSEHETSYYETLKAYLLNKMDHQKTAKKLSIHKNTVIYRIQRIEELFHLDLKDCRVITALYLSLFERYQRKDTRE